MSCPSPSPNKKKQQQPQKPRKQRRPMLSMTTQPMRMLETAALHGKGLSSL